MKDQEEINAKAQRRQVEKKEKKWVEILRSPQSSFLCVSASPRLCVEFFYLFTL
jgi:hypothetical protein